MRKTLPFLLFSASVVAVLGVFERANHVIYMVQKFGFAERVAVPLNPPSFWLFVVGLVMIAGCTKYMYCAESGLPASWGAKLLRASFYIQSLAVAIVALMFVLRLFILS